MKFTAAIQGIDLDEGKTDDEFEKVKARAQAKLLGVSEEQYELDGMIEIIDEDE